MESQHTTLAIIGAGNIGLSIAKGLVESEQFQPSQIHLTRRKTELLDSYQAQGFQVTSDNLKAVENSSLIIVAVEPAQIDKVLQQIGPKLLPEKHILISVVSSVTVSQIQQQVKAEIPVVRAMPNTAIAIRESMTCLTSTNREEKALEVAQDVFKAVGKTLVIDEEQMGSATALGACGVAFFLRAIRAASQGGIEIGFHSDEALMIAAQTARGAASLLLNTENHPEHEIDRVTTPRGCTISGLNRMEHEGFSSAMIKGIITSANKAQGLYPDRD